MKLLEAHDAMASITCSRTQQRMKARHRNAMDNVSSEYGETTQDISQVQIYFQKCNPFVCEDRTTGTRSPPTAPLHGLLVRNLIVGYTVECSPYIIISRWPSLMKGRF